MWMLSVPYNANTLRPEALNDTIQTDSFKVMLTTQQDSFFELKLLMHAYDFSNSLDTFLVFSGQNEFHT